MCGENVIKAGRKCHNDAQVIIKIIHHDHQK